jgi:hypothetical protein
MGRRLGAARNETNKVCEQRLRLHDDKPLAVYSWVDTRTEEGKPPCWPPRNPVSLTA